MEIDYIYYMKLLTIPPASHFKKGHVPLFKDHYLFIRQFDQACEYPEHYTGLGVIAVLKGEGQFKVNGANTTLNEKSFLIVNRGSTLSFSFSNNAQLALLYFNTELSKVISTSHLLSTENKKLPDIHDYTLIEHVHFMNATLKDYFRLLIALGDSCASFHSLKSDMVVRSILDVLVAENHDALRTSMNLEVVKKATRVDLYQRLSMAKKWVETNYSESVSLEQMADVAMLNSEHFLRVFKKAFDTTPRQFLIALRLKKACDLLKKSNKSVSEICHLVGFESLSSFSTLFKQRMGVTPGSYRKSCHSNSQFSIKV